MEKGRGIVMRTVKLGDTSLIVHWLTMEAGLIKTVAKGARRARSPFAGLLDLFVEAELVWVPSRRSDLHILKEASVLDFKPALRRSYTAISLAAYFGQLLEGAVEREHPVPELFELLAGAFDYLESHPPTRKVLLHYERRLAERLGIASAGMDPAAALEQACGVLPKARSECLGLLNHEG